MIIPIYNNYKFKEGDIIISLKDINYGFCVFTKKHEFTIKHIKSPYEINNKIIDNENGIEVSIGTLDDFTLKCDLNAAKKRFVYLNNNSYLSSFILKNCPNKDYSYEEYTRYDSCKIKSPYGYNDECIVDIEKCISHIPLSIVKKDEKILEILRLRKIKKIKNVL